MSSNCSGENQNLQSITKFTEQLRIIEDEFMMDYLNRHLLQYPESNRENAFEIARGYQKAIYANKDNNHNEIEKTYNTLYRNFLSTPQFQGLEPRLAAISLAKVYTETINYLPKSAVFLIYRSPDDINSDLRHLQISGSEFTDNLETGKAQELHKVVNCCIIFVN